MTIDIAEFFFRHVCILRETIEYLKIIRIKKQARGMMGHQVYKRIYDLVCALPDLDIVEIGGAAGAGSITIANAMKDSHKKSNLIVVEKCEGGSRAKFGGYQDNLNIIKNNFKRFKVEEIITLFPKSLAYENKDEVISLVETGKIAALIHDADGRIDRDFCLFWPLLNVGGLIVIDDYQDCSKYLSMVGKHPSMKKRTLTYRLLNQFIEWGLFGIDYCVEDTVFGHKPAKADFNKFDLQVCQKIVEGVQLEIKHHLNPLLG